MNFTEATDILFTGVTHAELAEEMGVSIASIRQARLRPDAAAHRRPPDNWEAAVARLAERRARHLSRLADKLKP